MKSEMCKSLVSLLLVIILTIPVLAEVTPLIQTQWRNFTWPYNAYYPEEPNGINGHLGNACGPTTIAHLLKYHAFPIQGYDSLTFVSSAGDTWDANFAATTYEWDRMPDYLHPSATEAEYSPTATLVYHAAVCMHDIHSTGVSPTAVAEGMSRYFGYTDSTVLKNRWEHTLEEWNQFFYDELDAGRPILVSGRTVNSPAPWEPGNVEGHYWICDGYNDEGQFHLVYGYGDYDHYYDQDNFGAHQAYNNILIGLQPMYLGGTLTFTEPQTGEYFQDGSDIEIEWTVEGSVEEIRLVWTSEETTEWSSIAENVDASSGSYVWTIPENIEGQVTIRIHDQEEINLYDATTIEVYSDSSVELIQPNGGEYYQRGAIVPILFQSDGTPTVSIHYSANGGSDWAAIYEGVLAINGNADWVVPDNLGADYLVRVRTDLDTTSYDISDEVFEVGEDEMIGGPYAFDDNTLILMSFNGDATNIGVIENHGTCFGSSTFSLNDLSGMGEALRIENTPDINGSCVIVSNESALDISGDWTIEGWFKASSLGNEVCQYPIIARIPGENSFFDAPIWIGIDMNRNAFNANCLTTMDDNFRLLLPQNSLQVDNWYHVAFVRDVENSRIWLILHNANRELVHSESHDFSSSEVLANSSESLFIGGVSGGSNMQFDGWVDEFRFSNVARPSVHTSAVEERANINSLPDHFELMSVYPNPFNPSLTAVVSLPVPSDLTVHVFNVMGQRVTTIAEGHFKEGFHSFVFNGQNMASGIYLIQVVVPSRMNQVKKVVLMK